MSRATARKVGRGLRPRQEPPPRKPDRRTRRPTIRDLFPPQGQWTEADYFALPETNWLVELSEGKVVILDVPGYSHQHAVFELAVALRAFVRERGLGTVAVAPLTVRLWPGKLREPDGVYHLLDRWGAGEVARSEILAGLEEPVDAVVRP